MSIIQLKELESEHDREERVSLLASRREAGLDLWTGEPLVA
jgi:hypothetical protein